MLINDILMILKSEEEVMSKKLSEITVADLLVLMETFVENEETHKEAQGETREEVQGETREEGSRIVTLDYFIYHNTDNKVLSTRLRRCILFYFKDRTKYLSNTNKKDPYRGEILIDLDAFVKYLKENEISLESGYYVRNPIKTRWDVKYMGEKTEKFMLERLKAFGFEL